MSIYSEFPVLSDTTVWPPLNRSVWAGSFLLKFVYSRIIPKVCSTSTTSPSTHHCVLNPLTPVRRLPALQSSTHRSTSPFAPYWRIYGKKVGALTTTNQQQHKLLHRERREPIGQWQHKEQWHNINTDQSHWQSTPTGYSGLRGLVTYYCAIMQSAMHHNLRLYAHRCAASERESGR